MRLPNSFGSIAKLSGKRRKPWIARITVKWELEEETMKYKQVQKALGYYATRQEALSALLEYHNNPFALGTFDVTFGECYEHIINDLKRQANYRSAFKYLAPIKETPIRKIKTDDMQKCVDSCSTTQQADIVFLCHKIYDYALAKDIVVKNPSSILTWKTKDVQIVRNVFTVEEIKFIEMCDVWWKKCLCCLLYSGMRTKELKTLEYDDIDLEEMTINIREAKNRASIRKIPIHKHAESVFRDYKENGLGLYGKTHNGLNDRIMNAFDITHHAHDARHTFATKLRECGCDDLVVQRLLGHTPTTITHKVYTHLSMDELRDSLNQLSYY